MPQKAVTIRRFQANSGSAYLLIRTHLHTIYRNLGVSSKLDLVAFFPIDQEDDLLDGKTLGQLRPRELEIMEGISVGVPYKAIAARSHLSVSTIRTHIHNAQQRWPDCDGRAAILTRVANGIRASYISRVNGNGRRILGNMGGYALHNLVDHEDRIIELLDSQPRLDPTPESQDAAPDAVAVDTVPDAAMALA
ncbi:MAG TPA: LuxR C-terminal-related transcriptional regulator [Candidatus Saccharimonadales bacterium]|nr:LuxR C-terminal-related transcriptional regulator [Candidatus Saccharimonadales bacterium]